MLLESFRHDPIGNIYFVYIDDEGERNTVDATYINYAFRAFYLTMQDIEQLEYAKGSIVPDGSNSIAAVSLWFLTIEAHITTLLKLACYKKGHDFKNYRGKKIADRLTALCDFLEFDAIAIKKTGLHSRLNEFTDFRNEIFHDRNFGYTTKNFTKTLFSEVPVQCNLIDVMQGLIIYIEITSLLRYAITGLDTMPDILINTNDKVFYKKLDYLYNVIIAPSFVGALEKHKLSTNLKINQTFPDPLQSELFLINSIRAYITSDSDEIFKFQMNQEETHIAGTLLFKLVESVNISPGKFVVPKYIYP